METPITNEITGTFRGIADSDHGQSCAPLKIMYLAKKHHQAGFCVRNPLWAGHGGGTNKFSSKKWQSWYAEATTRADDLNCHPKKANIDIKDFMPWVKVIALKIHRPLPSNILLNDLIQDGMIGLITSLREYDANLGIPFHAFAENKIKWAIMDGLRAGDWAGRSVRRRASKVDKTIEKLQALLHRKPTKSEIAETLGVRVDDIATTLGDAYGYSFVRIDDTVEGDAQDIPDSRMEPSAIVERRESYSRAIASLRILQPNERKAFILRIMCDLNGRQAADEMGLSESRVSQLYKTATEKLASYV